MCGVDEHPHAVDADEGDEGEAKAAEHEARVADGHGQGKDPHADVALQQVDNGLEVGDGVRRLARRVALDQGTSHRTHPVGVVVPAL